MNEAEYYIEKLLEYYNVNTLNELAEKLGMSQPSISAWKKNNYISAIKKRCRQLGIYSEIFQNTQNETFHIGDGSVGKVDGHGNKGIVNRSRGKTVQLHFKEEYKKLEDLAMLGKGYENLKILLNELKEKLKEDI